MGCVELMRMTDAPDHKPLSPREFEALVPSSSEYKAAFESIHLALPKNALRMLRTHYNAAERTLSASAMAAEMGYASYGSANLHYGRLGSMLCREFDIRLRLPLNILAHFVAPGSIGNKHWLWVMRQPIAQTLEHLGWVTAEPDSAVCGHT